MILYFSHTSDESADTHALVCTHTYTDEGIEGNGD